MLESLPLSYLLLLPLLPFVTLAAPIRGDEPPHTPQPHVNPQQPSRDPSSSSSSQKPSSSLLATILIPLFTLFALAAIFFFRRRSLLSSRSKPGQTLPGTPFQLNNNEAHQLSPPPPSANSRALPPSPPPYEHSQLGQGRSKCFEEYLPVLPARSHEAGRGRRLEMGKGGRREERAGMRGSMIVELVGVGERTAS
jgi:hypothetical protein